MLVMNEHSKVSRKTDVPTWNLADAENRIHQTPPRFLDRLTHLFFSPGNLPILACAKYSVRGSKNGMIIVADTARQTAPGIITALAFLLGILSG